MATGLIFYVRKHKTTSKEHYLHNYISRHFKLMSAPGSNPSKRNEITLKDAKISKKIL